MPRPERTLRRLAIGLALVALAAGGCGNDRAPVRVGVLVDCSGFVGSARDVVLAAASLPLVEQAGARPGAHGSVTGAVVAGRPVEVIPACTELTYFSRLVLAVRRLVEVHQVDAVIGPIGTSEAAILRRIAARFPATTFLAGPGLARETTLVDPQPNVFRFAPDGAQSVAGLGAYAYRDLGWRSAVVVGDGWSDGWELASGFVSEFCALGGTITERDWTSLAEVDPSAAARRHVATADGVAVLDSITSPIAYLQALAAANPELDRRLVLGGPLFEVPAVLAAPGLDVDGVVVAGAIPLQPTDGVAEFDRSLTSAYPQSSTAGLLNVLLPYYDAMSALVAALELTHGEPGEGQAALRQHLATLTLETPTGPVRLDANRQAIVRTYLDRIVMSPAGPAGVRGEVVDDVDQSLGGVVTPATPLPSPLDPGCQQAQPPPWAR